MYKASLLRAYVMIDTRFQMICRLVKFWAKERNLNDPWGINTLNSLVYELIVVQFLQTRT